MSGDRFRLWLATRLIWTGAHIAPRLVRPIFVAYCRMLEAFPEEIKAGRQFGVITVPWSAGPAGRGKAELMQARAMEAAATARKGIEVIAAQSPQLDAKPLLNN